MSQPRKPKGAPGGVGGQFDHDPTGGAADLPAFGAAPQGTAYESAQRTQELLDQAGSVYVTGDGLRIDDKDGHLLYQESDDHRLDQATLVHDKRVQRAVREAFADPMDSGDAAMTPSARRARTKAAFRLASPYSRRGIIDHSPNARYLPGAYIAHSLSHRRDQEAALDRLNSLYLDDASAAANVIRAGFPNDKHGAFRFINYTKVKRYSADDKNGHKRGEIMRDGNGQPIAESKGKNARSYLRMLWQPTNGVPDKPQVDDMCRALKQMDDTPQVQAEVFYEVCYGNGTPRNMSGMLGSNRTSAGRGWNRLDRASSERGNGNVARMLAYRKALTPQAAAEFLKMGPGDQRLAHTRWTTRKRDKTTGQMRDVTPARLTEMRSFIHAAYADDFKRLGIDVGR